MESYIVSDSHPLSSAILEQIAHAGPLAEVSNSPGSVRYHIFWHGDRDRTTNTLREPMLFFVYQTTREGPQSGSRLCLVNRGFHIPAPTKAAGTVDDEIDSLEKDIPQSHMEVVILGKKPASLTDTFVPLYFSPTPALASV